MASKQQYLTIAKDRIDEVMVKTLYMTRHSDVEGLLLLDKMRKALREALLMIECAENPTFARSRRVAQEVKMTGLEQEIGL